MTRIRPGALPVVLTVVADPELSAGVERVVAAAGARSVRADTPGRRDWLAAAAIVVDAHGAGSCARAGLPRRDGVLGVCPGEPAQELLTAAIAVGVRQICALPGAEAELAGHLADAVEAGAPGRRPGPVIGVTGGRGGAGASVFAAALAHCAGEALLVDVDPCGGGIDLVLGSESAPGLRWPDLRLQGGRLGWPAVREVLPRRRGVSVLSGTRCFHDIEPGALAAVVEAGRRAGVTVLCDIPRLPTPAAECALQYADLVVVLTSCDVRGAAGAAAVVSVLQTMNPAVGLVVRGPSPGGLLARDVAAAAAVPLVAAMRPEPMLARRLERGGLGLRRRSPLAIAARTVLDIVPRETVGQAA